VEGGGELGTTDSVSNAGEPLTQFDRLDVFRELPDPLKRVAPLIFVGAFVELVDQALDPTRDPVGVPGATASNWSLCARGDRRRLSTKSVAEVIEDAMTSGLVSLVTAVVPTIKNAFTSMKPRKVSTIAIVHAAGDQVRPHGRFLHSRIVNGKPRHYLIRGERSRQLACTFIDEDANRTVVEQMITPPERGTSSKA
jgi:hypothetical protein